MIRWFSKIYAEEGSSHMQSQYGSPSQAAAPALEYMGVSTPLTMKETIVVFVKYAIANVSA
jgi:hypothetical protein